MKLADMIRSDSDPDQLSHTKVWSNVAYLIASTTVVIQAIKGTLQTDLFEIYMIVVALHQTTSKGISLAHDHFNQKLASQQTDVKVEVEDTTK